MTEDDLRDSFMLRKMQAYNALMCSLRDRRIFYRQPSRRLAAKVAAELIRSDRHTPENLAHLLDCVTELRNRLMNAKV